MNLATLATDLFRWVLQTSWQAAGLVLLVLLVQRIFRTKLSPAWRYGLWLLVVARLLMPATPQSKISMFNLAKITLRQPSAATPAQPEPRAAEFAVSDPQGNSHPSDDDAFSTLANGAEGRPPWRGGDARPVGTAPTRNLRAIRPANWFEVACAVWLGGVGLLSLRLGWANVRFSSRLARLAPVADASIIRIVEQCAKSLGIRQTVSVIETGLAQSPAVCGWWKKRLLLPEGALERYSPEELRHIFLHELAHIKRRDIEVNWLAMLLQILHWFNPLIWLAFARMRSDRELATDAMALAQIGRSENILYGETILKVVENLAREAVNPGLVGIAEGKASLAERLQAIARCGAARPWRRAAIVVVVLVAGVGLTAARQTQTSDASGKKESAAAATKSVSAKTGDGKFSIRVLDLANGSPLPGVALNVTLDYFAGDSIKKDAITDKNGQAAIPYSEKDLKRLAYTAQKADFIPLRGEWIDQELCLLGEEFQIRLDRGAEIGGSVVDENGRPVAGAEVSFGHGWTVQLAIDYYGSGSLHNEVWAVSDGQRVAVTGPAGVWRAKCVWPGHQWASLRIHHPDFADVICSTELTSAMQAEGKGVKLIFEDLAKQTARLTLPKGIAVTGRVTDGTGVPLSGIAINWAEWTPPSPDSDKLAGRRIVVTDATGRFRINHAPQKPLFFLVQTNGFAPAATELDPTTSSAEVELRLVKGSKLVGMVRDNLGEPVGHVHIALTPTTHWRGAHWESVSDSQGRFEWDDAPAGTFRLDFEKNGYIPQSRVVTNGSGEELSLRLDHALRITGKIVDAETKDPVKAFHIDWNGWNDATRLAEQYPFSAIAGSNGIYSIDMGRLHSHRGRRGYPTPFTFQVEADGYETFVSRAFDPKHGDVGDMPPYDIALKRAAQFSGTVVDANDHPVQGAQVGLKSPTARFVLEGQPSFSPATRGASFMLTDDKGRFHLNRNTGAKGLVVVHKMGFADIGSNALSPHLTVKLQPWGRIEGVVWEYDKLAANEQIYGRTAISHPNDALLTTFRADADAQGRFVFEFVPPGNYHISRSAGDPHAIAEVQPGETVRVKIGGMGRPVIGRLKLVHPDLEIDWTVRSTYFDAHTAFPRPPANYTTPEQVAAWNTGPEFEKAWLARRSYPMKVAADGSFRIDEVMPGEYWVRFSNLEPGHMAIIESEKPIDVPDSDTREPLDLGVFELAPKGKLKSGAK